MIVSSIKNRVRFLDDNIKENSTTEKIDAALNDLNGIEDFRITKMIGSLLVNYDEKQIKLSEITDILKEYIDVTEQLKQTSDVHNSKNYIDKASNLVKSGIGMGNGKGRGKGKGGRGRNSQGQGNGQGQSIGDGRSNSNQSSGSGLLNMAVNSFRNNGLAKTAIYGALGVQGYKKGKNIIKAQGFGKGKKK